METIDIIFWSFIILVVVGGIACLLIFLPREHEFDEKYKDCYRIMYRDGLYSITHKKATYGENLYSLRSKYFYIRKAPFSTDAFCDEAKAKDGMSYRASAQVTVYFPEDRLQIFAPNFHNVPHEAIEETVEEASSSALTEALAEYDPASEPSVFEGHLKEVLTQKLGLFGLFVMSVKNIRITGLRKQETE